MYDLLPLTFYNPVISSLLTHAEANSNYESVNVNIAVSHGVRESEDGCVYLTRCRRNSGHAVSNKDAPTCTY
jgi:hypothetical protein